MGRVLPRECVAIRRGFNRPQASGFRAATRNREAASVLPRGPRPVSQNFPSTRIAVTTPSVRVLGIDPGTLHLGWGVVQAAGNRIRHVAHGVIDLDPKTPL